MTAHHPAPTPARQHRNPVLCASAAWRLSWAAAALAALWLTTLWALS